MYYWPVKVMVDNVDGTCPFFKKGDSFFVERSALIPSESTEETGICFQAVARLTPELAMMTRGLIKGESFVACGDLPRRIRGIGARVLFRLIPAEKKEIIYATKEEWQEAKRNGKLRWKDSKF